MIVYQKAFCSAICLYTVFYDFLFVSIISLLETLSCSGQKVIIYFFGCFSVWLTIVFNMWLTFVLSVTDICLRYMTDIRLKYVTDIHFQSWTASGPQEKKKTQVIELLQSYC